MRPGPEHTGAGKRWRWPLRKLLRRDCRRTQSASWRLEAYPRWRTALSAQERWRGSACPITTGRKQIGTWEPQPRPEPIPPKLRTGSSSTREILILRSTCLSQIEVCVQKSSPAIRHQALCQGTHLGEPIVLEHAWLRDGRLLAESGSAVTYAEARRHRRRPARAHENLDGALRPIRVRFVVPL